MLTRRRFLSLAGKVAFAAALTPILGLETARAATESLPATEAPTIAPAAKKAPSSAVLEGAPEAQSTLTSKMVRKAVRELKRRNVPPFPDGHYRGAVSPYQTYDLMYEPHWADVAKYDIELLDGEIGKIYGVRFRESISESPMVLGGNGEGVTLSEELLPTHIVVPSFHVHPLVMPTRDDPLGQYGFVSIKYEVGGKQYGDSVKLTDLDPTDGVFDPVFLQAVDMLMEKSRRKLALIDPTAHFSNLGRLWSHPNEMTHSTTAVPLAA